MSRRLDTKLLKPSIASVLGMLLVLVAFADASGQAASTGQTGVEQIRTLQLDAWTRPGVGQFVPADDIAQYLVYELYVTNWNGPPPLRFAAVDVEDVATGRRLARLDTVALETPSTLRITPFPGRAGPANRQLPAGRTAILRIELKLPLGASVPAAVRHRIAFESNPALQLIQDDGSLTSDLVAYTEPMRIDRAPPVVIGPPLLGGPWYCSNGIGAFTSHDWIGASERTARMYVPARFGCDLSKAGASPRIQIKGVTGPIVISSGPTRTANIKVQRSAGTQRELDCSETKVDHRPDLITISYVQFTDRPGCGSLDSRHALALEVPSDAFLELSNIYYATGRRDVYLTQAH